MSDQTETTTTTAPVAPTDPLARISLELLAEYRVASEARDAADRTLSDAVTDMHGAENDFHVAELCRHLPGLAPTIHLVWAHVIDARLDRVGTCCTDGGMIDPWALLHGPGRRPGLSLPLEA